MRSSVVGLRGDKKIKLLPPTKLENNNTMVKVDTNKLICPLPSGPR